MADRMRDILPPEDQVDPAKVAEPIDCGQTPGAFGLVTGVTKAMAGGQQEKSSRSRAGWGREADQGWAEGLNGRHPLCLVDPSPQHWSASGPKPTRGGGGAATRWTR